MVEQYRNQGLVVLAVNAWNEEKDILKQYIEQNKFQQRVLLNGGSVSDRYGIPNKSVPTVFWIDRAGIVLEADLGSGNLERLERNTAKLVSQKS
jgi:hypothetical protein